MVDDSEDTEVVLTGDLPEQAYRALLGVDWTRFAGGMLMWDPDTRTWYDPNQRYAIETDDD